MSLKKYKKKKPQIVTGVQLKLDTKGFNYIKWGGEQFCKPGDWLVNNQGECYTVDQESFELTYSEVAPGQYIKTAPIWAKQTDTAGLISTKEGKSAYKAGDYITCNNADGTDTYTIPKDQFEKTYSEADQLKTFQTLVYLLL